MVHLALVQDFLLFNYTLLVIKSTQLTSAFTNRNHCNVYAKLTGCHIQLTAISVSDTIGPTDSFIV